MTRIAIRVFAVLLLVHAPSVRAAEPLSAPVKNVILIVADGAGFNTWDAASMVQGRWDAAAGRSRQVYDGPEWSRFACSTYPLNTAKVPSGSGLQEADVVYDPSKAWEPESAYAWLTRSYTDSAAAATALSTGVKTYNNAINWSDRNEPIRPTLSEAAKAAGKSVGVVTTVEWSHATPAGLSNAHNVDRDNYAQIANAMLDGDVMDVIMGAGNPDFDNNGRPVTGARQYKYVGGAETWAAIEQARAADGGTYRSFRPVSTKAEFEALTAGETPGRVLGTAQVATTLQQARRKAAGEDPAAGAPRNAGVPDLVTMVRGALNVLDENPQGLFLLVEGGAIDWAAHRNDAERLMEEQIELVRAVEAVVAWVETDSNWDESLVVLTADHETGLVWGPRSDTLPFDPIVDEGPELLPEMRFNSKGHTNSLVPLYARGTGRELLKTQVVGEDPVYGPYLDNIGLARVLLHAAAGAPLEPPSEAEAERQPANDTVVTQPDIVLIMPDQMRGDGLSVLGRPVVRTPQLDRLARIGIPVRHTMQSAGGFGRPLSHAGADCGCRMPACRRR